MVLLQAPDLAFFASLLMPSEGVQRKWFRPCNSVSEERQFNIFQFHLPVPSLLTVLLFILQQYLLTIFPFFLFLLRYKMMMSFSITCCCLATFSLSRVVLCWLFIFGKTIAQPYIVSLRLSGVYFINTQCLHERMQHLKVESHFELWCACAVRIQPYNMEW